MARVGKRPAAKRDIIARYLWYAENASVEIADRFLLAVDSTATILSSQPESGNRIAVKRAQLQGMRRFPVGDGFEKVLLFYLPIPGGIDLIRVVHGMRDIERLLVEGFFG